MIVKSVNIDNIRSNIIKLKSICKTKFCAVVKANAYGHGLEICQGINDLVDFYAVATKDEALKIKKMKLHKKILMLSKFDYNDLTLLIKNQIRLTVDSLDDVVHIVSTAISMHKKVYVHIKINTGMNRLGTKSKSEFLEIYNALKSCEYCKVEGIFTHYATAESKNSYKLKRQNAKFLSIINQIPHKELKKIIVHSSNSSGFLKSSKYAYDMVRVGIAMYGYDQTDKLELKPALNIKAKIVKVVDIKKGESVGYGAEFIAPTDMKIAVVAMGYADGFIRQYKNASVLIQGQRCKIVGRICMDMFMCDVTHLYLSHTQKPDFDIKNQINSQNISDNDTKHNFMDEINELFKGKSSETLYINNDTIYKLFKDIDSNNNDLFNLLPLGKILQNILSTIQDSLEDFNLDDSNSNLSTQTNKFDLVGEYATVLGQDGGQMITAKELAQIANTIEYEVLTNFNLLRL